MKDEYIIINKTEFEKILEDLEDLKRTQHANGELSNFENTYGKIEGIKHVLSQSTPLIPEIEKTFNASKITTGMNQRNQFAYKYKNSKDYISNLKLEI